MLFRILIPALLAAALAFHPKRRSRARRRCAAANDDLAAFSLNDLKTLAAARGIDVSDDREGPGGRSAEGAADAAAGGGRETRPKPRLTRSRSTRSRR